MNLNDDFPEESKENKVFLRESQEFVALPCRAMVDTAGRYNSANNGPSVQKDVNKHKLVTLCN